MQRPSIVDSSAVIDHLPADHHHHSAPSYTAQQPSARMCFVCGVENLAGLGIRFFNDGPGQARATVTLSTQFQGYPGVAHGGIVTTILDETIGRAPMSGDAKRFMFTAKIEVRFRLPVPLGVPLTVTARLEKDRGRMAIGIGEIRLPDGTLAADATATLMAIPPETLQKMAAEEDSWRVYPEG